MSIEKTLTDEQIKKMTSFDLINVIYHCQFIKDKEEIDGITSQLWRILSRMVRFNKLNLNQIFYNVELDDLDNMLMNGIINDDEWDKQHDELVKEFNPPKTIDDIERNGMSYREYRDEVHRLSRENVSKMIENGDLDVRPN